MNDDSTSYLIYLGAAEGGGAVGLLFDWDALTALVQEQVEDLTERDFALALFDADAEAAFLAAHRETIYETGPASRWMDRVRLGIWAADTSAATGYYRTRNYLVGGGIFALAVSVVLGGLMILRDAGREVQVARLRSEFVANVSHELRTPTHVHPHVRRDSAHGPLPVSRTDAGLSDYSLAREPTAVALGG